jgi:hypothetical protein
MNIDEIQWRLHQHHLRYSLDICNMKTSEKIQHYALVVGSLAAQFCAQPPRPRDGDVQGVHLLYAVLSLSSFLNLNIQKRADYNNYACPTIGQNVRRYHGSTDYNVVVPMYLGQMGRLCKIAEAIDHMEPMDFRTETHAVLDELYQTAYRVMALEGLNGKAESAFASFVREIEQEHFMREKFGMFSLEEDCYLPL